MTYKGFIQFSNYSLISSFTFLLDILLLLYLKEILVLDIILSTALAFIFSVTMAYFLNRKFTYLNPSRASIFVGYERFLIVAIITLCFVLVGMWFFVDILDFNYLIARISIGVLALFLSYIFDTKYAFGSTIK